MGDYGDVLRTQSKAHRKLYVHSHGMLCGCWSIVEVTVVVPAVLLTATPSPYPSLTVAMTCVRRTRSIRLTKMDEHTNIEKLAQDIIDSCDLIHVSKLPKLIGAVCSVSQW